MSERDQHTMRVQQLFVRHHDQLRGMVYALLPDFAKADDVIQEVFLTVTSKAQEFDLNTSFLAWSRAIVRLKILESHRQSKAGSPSFEVLESLVASCPDDWAGDEQAEALARCLEELAPKAREMMILRYKFEHSPTEIAKLLSRTVNSVNVALSKARIVLRECMDRQLSPES
ncbi:MAG TPA: sigma-70 family RNA polymerase sigma factor [Planctomicrobium sp.]|nr:sigma-70 family RNA polymerase sigma factor [Planctomicrobium sp.]